MKAFQQSRTARNGWGATGLCLASAVASTSAVAETADDASNKDLTPVVVTSKPSLVILSQKLRDTPQSIDVVPQQVLTEQAVTNIQDALKNVPGITLNAGEGGSHGDTINIRGFPASDDFFLDGLRDTGFYTRDSFDLEAVEVYKGPASTLFGRGSTGGVVNQVSKTPKLNSEDSASFTGGTNDELRATADINAPLSEDAAVRVNLMGQRSGFAGRPNSSGMP